MGYRHTEFTCICGRPLAPGRRAKFEYSQCTGCDGIWVSHDELPKLLATVSRLDAHQAATTELGSSQRACLVCNENMLRLRIGKTEAEYCEHHGYWFDRGELGDVLRYHRDHKPEPEPVPYLGPKKRKGGYGVAGAIVVCGLLGAIIFWAMQSKTSSQPSGTPIRGEYVSESLATQFEFPDSHWRVLPPDLAHSTTENEHHEAYLRVSGGEDGISLSVYAIRMERDPGEPDGKSAQVIETMMQASAAISKMACSNLRARPLLIRCTGLAGSDYDHPIQVYHVAFTDYMLYAVIAGSRGAVSKHRDELDAIMLSTKSSQ